MIPLAPGMRVVVQVWRWQRPIVREVVSDDGGTAVELTSGGGGTVWVGRTYVHPLTDDQKTPEETP